MRTLLSRRHLVGFIGVGATCALGWYALANRAPSLASDARSAAAASHKSADETQVSGTRVRVETVKPQKGGLERTTTQPGTIIAFESAQLFAKVSGYLKSQVVDIGDRVGRGQILAEIDAPELLKAVDQAKAAVAQAQAQLVQAQARILTAEADRDAALAAIKQAEAEIVRTEANFKFRKKQFIRISELAKSQSVDQRLADEKEDEMESARAAEELAHAGVANAKALAKAADARVVQSRADADEAKSKVDVASAELAKAQVFADYLKIVSPYDGVVTNRNFFRGDFIQSADKDARTPLLAVDRTDLMRAVVQVPDRDVPFTHVGDPATVEIDALPGARFSAKVSRVADAEDTQTRTMRTEIDIPNPDRVLRQGMYGRVTIHLGTLPGASRIPSSAVVGAVKEGKGAVYVCRQNVARLVPVRLGRDDGTQVEVLEGLTPNDEVVRQPSTALFDGAPVTIAAAEDVKPAGGNGNGP
jgi:HlyD family secretion protein